MPVTGVPKNRVGQVVQDFVNDDVPVVVASREGNASTYTVSEGDAFAGAGLVARRTGAVDFISRERDNHARHGKRKRKSSGRRR